jgi:hypothetical protein
MGLNDQREIEVDDSSETTRWRSAKNLFFRITTTNL